MESVSRGNEEISNPKSQISNHDQTPINPSWGRQTDFEDVLDALGCTSEQQKSSSMADLDLSAFDVIIIPGAQESEFYSDYINNVERFDDYVAKGGTLLHELNGAEYSPIVLPSGVTMTGDGAVENAILKPDHPIFFPLKGKRMIHAYFASHGYLQNVPSDAIVLAVEAYGEEIKEDRPTFIEYSHGKGLVLAAVQCFHDRDDSGRGPMMESVISYVMTASRAAGP